jgi:peptide/nickel transport system permease protein
MGQLLLQAVLEEDIPVAMAAFSFVGVFALIAHLIADISYSYLDPRIRVKSQG